MYLVDNNVLSVGASTKAQPMPGLAAWMSRNSDHLYLFVITVAEVEDGIAKARRTGATRKTDQLAAWLQTLWLQTLLHLYSARILPLDVTVVRRLGKLADQARGAGQAPGLADLTIAATAAERGFTVLTRNLRHFQGPAVAAHDPFKTLPGSS